MRRDNLLPPPDDDDDPYGIRPSHDQIGGDPLAPHPQLYTEMPDDTARQLRRPPLPELPEPSYRPDKLLSQPDEIAIPTNEHHIFTDLGRLIARQAEVHRALNAIDMPEADIAPLKRKVELTAVAQFLKEAEELSREVAIESVNNGMSRVQAADLLGVHQATIAKWLKEGPRAIESDDS